MNSSSYRSLLLSIPALDILQSISEQRNCKLYVVGGFVRDFLLQRPSKDVDIVCIGDGLKVAESFGQRIKAPVQLFKNYGTAMVKYKGWEIEFVKARKESYNKNSRNPSVTAASLIEDLSRRDFTINTLAIPLQGSKMGELIDLFGGVEDLKKSILRTPLGADKTFFDDPLRMWRAVRFSVTLGSQLDNATYEGIRENSHRSKILSQERITAEFNRILLAKQPSKGLALLAQLGLLDFFLPELLALKGKEKRGGFSHKDNFWHTLQVVDNVANHSDKLYLRWAALLHDIAKPYTKRFTPLIGFTFHGHEEIGARMVPKIFRRLRLPLAAPMRYVQQLVRLHLRPIALVQKVTDAAIRRLMYDAGEALEDLMLLCRADITSKSQKRLQQYLANFDLVERKMKEIEAKDHIRTLQPVIKGEQIMSIFDLSPGKRVGLLKNQLKEAILEGKISNQPEPLYQYLLKIAAQQDLFPQKKN